MSLREDAIRAYELRQEKFRKESEDRLNEKREAWRKIIVEVCNKAFGRDPDSVTVDENGNRFSIEDLTFVGPPDGGFYGDKWRLDLGTCPECDGPIYNPYSFSLWNKYQEDVLATVGDTLEAHEAGRIHSHQTPDTESENKVPSPPLQIVKYPVDSVEVQLLDSIREYVDDRIEERTGDR